MIYSGHVILIAETQTFFFIFNTGKRKIDNIRYKIFNFLVLFFRI